MFVLFTAELNWSNNIPEKSGPLGNDTKFKYIIALLHTKVLAKYFSLLLFLAPGLVKNYRKNGKKTISASSLLQPLWTSVIFWHQSDPDKCSQNSYVSCSGNWHHTVPLNVLNFLFSMYKYHVQTRGCSKREPNFTKRKGRYLAQNSDCFITNNNMYFSSI